MKRIIKFRAWHQSMKEMFWFDIMDGIKSGTGGGFLSMAPFGEPITKRLHKDNMREVDPTECDIMQFTGLTDKNGVEIYEGDIYKTWYSRDTSGKDIVDVIEVVEFEIKHDTVVCEILFIQNCKIIGNIHQNPNLI